MTRLPPNPGRVRRMFAESGNWKGNPKPGQQWRSRKCTRGGSSCPDKEIPLTRVARPCPGAVIVPGWVVRTRHHQWWPGSYNCQLNLNFSPFGKLARVWKWKSWAIFRRNNSTLAGIILGKVHTRQYAGEELVQAHRSTVMVPAIKADTGSFRRGISMKCMPYSRRSDRVKQHRSAVG